ncbi:MAG: aldo/keto reductase [Planctomycetota bacterium]
MQYRKFGKLDFQASALGFGCMRLPILGEDANKVDESLAIEMIRYAIDHGVNYIDSAHGYHGGNSEKVVGKALQDGYRAKVKVATKLPPWACKTADDFDRLLDEQRKRLQVEKIDVYLLHNMQVPFWKKLRDLNILDWLDRIQADGRVGVVGFSFHDDYDLLTEVINAYDQWAMCQIQYNYMNEDVQAGTKGLKFAADNGLAVVIMEPLLGGCLAKAPEPVQAILDRAPTRRTPADWALQWLWHKPEVAVVLSGMTAMEHVVENVASAERSGVGRLTAEELDIIAQVQEKYAELRVVPCTQCGYCMPCPNDVDIPKNMQLYSDAMVFRGNQLLLNRNLYRGMAEEQRAGACEGCKECEEKCPQHIKISQVMPKIHEQFGK